MNSGDLNLKIDGKIYKTCDGLYNFDSVRFSSILNGLKDHKIEPN